MQKVTHEIRVCVFSSSFKTWGIYCAMVYTAACMMAVIPLAMIVYIHFKFARPIL